MGYRTGLANRFMAVMAAYLANLGIPRSGEFLRGALMTTYEEVPFEKAFGTIISERLADFIMLLSLVALAIGLQTDLLLEYFAEQNINPLYTLIFLVAVIAMIFVGFKILNTKFCG